MKSIDTFFSLEELVERWASQSLTLKKLVRYAMQGLLEVRVICPDFFESKWPGDNEVTEHLIDDSFEYLPVEPAILTDIVGRGLDHVPPSTYISRSIQRRTIRRTEFCDLVVTREEVLRFERHLHNDSGEKISTSDAEDSRKRVAAQSRLEIDEGGATVQFRGRKFHLTPPQIACVRVMEERRQAFVAGTAQSPDMHQKQIIEQARLTKNILRLDQVFKSRPSEFSELIKKCGPGRFSLRTDEDREPVKK